MAPDERYLHCLGGPQPVPDAASDVILPYQLQRRVAEGVLEPCQPRRVPVGRHAKRPARAQDPLDFVEEGRQRRIVVTRLHVHHHVEGSGPQRQALRVAALKRETRGAMQALAQHNRRVRQIHPGHGPYALGACDPGAPASPAAADFQYVAPRNGTCLTERMGIQTNERAIRLVLRFQGNRVGLGAGVAVVHEQPVGRAKAESQEPVEQLPPEFRDSWHPTAERVPSVRPIGGLPGAAIALVRRVGARRRRGGEPIERAKQVIHDVLRERVAEGVVLGIRKVPSGRSEMVNLMELTFRPEPLES